MSQKELTRLQVLTLVRDGRLAQKLAAERLGLSSRQVRRLALKLESSGAKGLVHANRGRPAPNRIDPQLSARILKLVETTYFDFNDTHLCEMLAEREDIRIGRETLRSLLRASGRRSKRRRRPPKHHRRRLRSPAKGLLLLWDGSPHHWFGPEKPPCTLMYAIDDADGELIEGFFVPQETSAAYLRLLDGIVRKKGIPVAIYQDRHGALKRNDSHWTIQEQLNGEQNPTQVGSALRDLGIRPIFALSPQAKGRVERSFGVDQDRLCAEMRLAGVDSIQAGTAFLKEHWIERRNQRFKKEPQLPVSAYRSSAKIDLNKTLAFRYPATVANDNTVSLGGKVLQIPPGPGGRSYAKAKVEARQHLDGSWSVYYNGLRIAQAPPSPLREPVRINRRSPNSQIGSQDFLVYPPSEDFNPADIIARQLRGQIASA